MQHTIDCFIRDFSGGRASFKSSVWSCYSIYSLLLQDSRSQQQRGITTITYQSGKDSGRLVLIFFNFILSSRGQLCISLQIELKRKERSLKLYSDPLQLDLINGVLVL